MCERRGLGADDLCGEFEVRLKGEQGVGSAVLREWMDIVASEVFLFPQNRLLRSYDRQQTFLPDPAATFCNPQWQMDYEALGRLFGLALWQSCTLNLPLHPYACALLFGFKSEVGSLTLADVDEELDTMKAKWLLQNEIDRFGLEVPFADSLMRDDLQEGHALGSSTLPEVPTAGEVRNLPPVVGLDDRLPGSVFSWPGEPLLSVGMSEVTLDQKCFSTLVTDANKADFVKALTEWRLHEAIEPQIEAMRRGLGRVIPQTLFKEIRNLLSASEISQLLSGLGDIDVSDWEEYTAYSQGLKKEMEVVRWFWRTVRAWSATPEDHAKLSQLLQFVTGSARVPVGGFRELVGFNGAKHLFTLSKATHLTAQSLPMAHACICTLDIPMYDNEEQCRFKLSQMLSLGRSHFDESAGRAADE